MKCPIFCANVTVAELEDKRIQTDCLAQECAWWMPLEGRCAELHKSFELPLIRQILFNIEEKMPSPEAFKK